MNQRNPHNRAIRLTIVLSILLSLFWTFIFTTGADAVTDSQGIPVDVDKQFAQLRLFNANGTPLSNIAIKVDAIPLKATTWGNNAYSQVGVGKTDAYGHVLVNLNALAAHNTALLTPDGISNYELYAFGPSGIPVPVYAMTRYYGSDINRANEFAQLIAHHATVNVPIDAVNLMYKKTTATNTPNGCVASWVTYAQTDAWTVAGEYHTLPWASRSDFAYGTEADSNIGIGYSYNYESTWSVSGTVNLSSSTSSRVQDNRGGQSYGHQEQIYVHYLKQRFNCNGWTGESRVIATNWNGGGLRSGADVSGNDNHRNRYTVALYSGQDYTRNSSSAYTYNGGVNIFGASLTTQSGFSSFVELSWHANTTGYLVGNDNFPSYSTIIYVSN